VPFDGVCGHWVRTVKEPRPAHSRFSSAFSLLVRDDRDVRTTLDLDDDVLQAVKELAEARGMTAGQALSALARQALTRDRLVRTRNGIPVLPRHPAKAARPTMKLVNELRDLP
jgi:hypothetical protein